MKIEVVGKSEQRELEHRMAVLNGSINPSVGQIVGKRLFGLRKRIALGV
jgi:hypothetical protein